MILSIYIFLGILICILEWRRRSRNNPIDAMTAFNAAYFILFVLVPINIMFLGEDVVRQKNAYETYGPGDISTALALSFCYVLFYIGYHFGVRRSSGPKNKPFPVRDSARIAKIVFFLGALFTTLYTIQMGGIIEAVSKATAARFGDIAQEGTYAFYVYFCELSSYAFVLYFAVLMGKRAKKMNVTVTERAFLSCAFLVFVYYALSTAGRRTLIYPILLCFLIYWSLGRKVGKSVVLALILIFVISGLGTYLGFVVAGGNLATAFDIYGVQTQSDWQSLLHIGYDIASQGLADSYVHFVALQKASLWQFGFLQDIVNLPRDLLPSRLLGFEKNWELSRQVDDFYGEAVRRGPGGEPVGGGEPLGLHGLLLVNFGYAGMFIMFFILGSFYKWLHLRLKPGDTYDAVGWMVYWWIIIQFFGYVRDALLIVTLKVPAAWLTFALLVYYRSKRQVRVEETGAIAAHMPG